jgi:Fe2+ transport system protein FeoA
LFNFRKKHKRHQNGCHACSSCQYVKETLPQKAAQTPPEGSIPLTQASEDKKLRVQANSDIKTMEMGLYPGSIITLLHNDSSERNVIVKIHDQRYVIPRETADLIFVKK